MIRCPTLAVRGERAFVPRGADRVESEAPDRRRLGGPVEIRRRSARRAPCRPARNAVRHGLLAVVALVAVGCAQSPTQVQADALDAYAVDTTPFAAPAIPELASLDAELPDDSPAAIRAAREAFEDRRRELTRRGEDQEERARALEKRREEASLRREIAVTEGARTVENAERALRHAEEDLAYFRTDGRRRRVEDRTLALQAAEDELAAAREELTQLEFVGGDELATGTDPVALARARRRVELAEHRRGLEAEALRDLEERELPRDEERLTAAVDDARVHLENARRGAAAVELEQNAILRAILVEERELARDAEDLAVELARLETEIAEWDIERGAR